MATGTDKKAIVTALIINYKELRRCLEVYVMRGSTKLPIIGIGNELKIWITLRYHTYYLFERIARHRGIIARLR